MRESRATVKSPDERWEPYGWVAALTVAAALRLPALGSIPNPNGDEGNWFRYAMDLSEAWPVALSPTARFVSLLFARMIAGSFTLLGPSFFAARVVPALGTVAAVAALRPLTSRLGLPRAGLCLAALVAVHPWSVLWSRTVTVPYALSFGLAVCAPLALLDALRSASTPRWLLAALLHAVGLHFSPLALAPCVASALFALAPSRRSALSKNPRALALSALTALVVAAPVAIGAWGVAAEGATRQQRFFNNLGPRVWVFGRTTLGALAGEPTVRHFTGRHFNGVGEALAAALGLALVAYALGRRSRSEATPPAVDELVAYARINALSALVGIPLLLAPVRPWNLPAIDAERYLWVLLAPLCIAVATLAEGTRARWVPWAFALYLLAVPTARCGWYFARGGGPDRGFYTLAGGGGDRGWKVSSGRVALPDAVIAGVEAARGGETVTLVMADYAWNPLHALASRRPWLRVVDVSKAPLPERAGELHLFVVWSEGLFVRGYAPPEPPRDDARLRVMMEGGGFEGRRLVRRFVQPGGAPLCELWVARRR